MNDHSRVVLQQLVQAFAAGSIMLDNFHMHIIGSRQCSTYGRFAASHDDDVLNVSIVFLAYNLTDIGDIILRCHKIGQIIDLQHIQTARDDGFVTSFDGYHMIRIVRTAKILQWLVQNLCLLTQFDAQQHQCPVVHIPALTYP